MYVSDRSIASLAASATAAVFLFASTMLAVDHAGAEPSAAPPAPLAGMTVLPDSALSELPAIRASAAVVQRAAAGDAPVYGVNTGFGKLANQRISTEMANRAVKNATAPEITALICSSACPVL